jgi:glycosyltransferase involved in cell wall biosynthesis
MVIAVNCRLLQKNRLEGIGWFTYETLRRITRDHPEHQFIFIFDRPYSSEFIFSDNITPVVAGFPTRHPILWLLWFEVVIPRVLRKYKADIFFSPDGFLSLRTKVKSIPVIHDISFVHRPHDLPFWPRVYYNYFFPRFARKAYRICTVSLHSQKDMNRTWDTARAIVRVVHNGANAAYQPLTPEEIQSTREKYTGGQPYFLYVGSLHPRKNVGNLLEAYSRFCSEAGPEVRMVVVGERMWKKDRRPQTADRRLETADGRPQTADGTGPATVCRPPSAVLFTGRLEPDELRLVMGAALALTFVPWYEGFGIPVVEAMAAGVPVLTSHVTSLPEVGGDAVLYADPASVESIADGMKRLSTDQELRAGLITKGLERSRNFSWDKTARKVWMTIDTVIRAIRTYK